MKNDLRAVTSDAVDSDHLDVVKFLLENIVLRLR